MRLDNVAELQADEGVYWIHLAGDKDLPKVLVEGWCFFFGSSFLFGADMLMYRNVQYRTLSGHRSIIERYCQRWTGQKSAIHLRQGR